MKKIITSLLMLALSVFVTTGVVHATDAFNTDPGDLPTVMVTNVTQGGGCGSGPGAGCWHTSITANPGDTIAVQVYFHNSTIYLAESTQVGMNPKISNAGTSHTYYGKVASTSLASAQGQATVQTTSAQTITFIPGTVRVYKHGQSVGYTVPNESALFGTGVPIGNVSPGWDTQGTITAQFKVGNNVVQQDYECNDGIDNDGDGYIDYPSDPGCSSPTDDSEYNSTQNNQCEIDSFDADDYSINDGDSTDLNWHTTGCDYVTISPLLGTFDADDSTSVDPSHTTTYTLKAYDQYGSVRDTDTLTISVDQQQNNTCSVDDFYASPTTIDRGNDSTLRWSTSGDVDYVTISGLSGSRSDDGSVSVSPYSTQSYTLHAYCNNGDTDTDSVTVNVRNVTVDSAPQAITTVATVLSGSQARLNGIAVPNTTNSSTSAWFEWGITGAFGNRTASQNITSGNSSQYYSDIVSGLVPGGTYFYRAVVQNQNGTAYGDTVRFQTTRTSPPVVVVPPTPVVHNVVVAQSAPSLLKLSVESNYDRMCISGTIDYTITYENISSQTLQKAVLQFNHPKELTYLSASRGHYEVVDRTMTIDLGDIAPREQGIITVHARVNETAISGNLTVATASVVYTNSKTHAQEDAVAYSLITVSNDCPNLLGASVFGFGSFLPNTLLGWLLLILAILALIVLARNIYKKKE